MTQHCAELVARPSEPADRLFHSALFVESRRKDVSALDALTGRRLLEFQEHNFEQVLRAVVGPVVDETWQIGPEHVARSVVHHVVTSEGARALRIAWLAVSEASQRRGVGSTVVAAVLAQGLPVTTRVLPSNGAALALFEGSGFRVVDDEGADLVLRFR